MSSQKFISIGRGEAPPFEEWQEVECPARLDLAGEKITCPVLQNSLDALYTVSLRQLDLLFLDPGFIQKM